MIVAGDIGGTKTHLALFDWKKERVDPVRLESFHSADYTSLEDMLTEFLVPAKPPTPIDEYTTEKSDAAEPEPERPEEEPDGSWKVILEVITNPMVLLLCLVYFCFKPVRYAILFWGPRYVSDKLGTGMAESSFISSMFSCGSSTECWAQAGTSVSDSGCDIA